MSLHELALKHGTDKANHSHTFMGESYLHIYELYFAPIRFQPLNVLELGVRDGASLRMWKEYFPSARIFGVDIDSDCEQHGEERIRVTCASQDDEAVLTELAERAGGFDIVIDDASHINILTRASFRILFPHLNPGGFYVIEDLGMSHLNLADHVDEPGFFRGELDANRERGVDLQQSRDGLRPLFDRILFEMDMHLGDVRLLHFWSQLAIVQRGGLPGGHEED